MSDQKQSLNISDHFAAREVASSGTGKEEAAEKKRFEDLPAPAQRALREAEARRTQIDAITKGAQKELNGRGGLDPARYNDWEVKGITSDF